ncbi:hypothetical protein O6H91_05G092400 [Diphasiastrum complanatum]|uniref:Uncharacterized protein n=1 Tax=Diphasiastrum complanatum TaxID=34168 RepID=A0ACC2DQW8_DIPCM|nr:hypothetical protein O6H91_05G092400 [Diphasiastrum complanatum]
MLYCSTTLLLSFSESDFPTDSSPFLFLWYKSFSSSMQLPSCISNHHGQLFRSHSMNDALPPRNCSKVSEYMHASLSIVVQALRTRGMESNLTSECKCVRYMFNMRVP